MHIFRLRKIDNTRVNTPLVSKSVHSAAARFYGCFEPFFGCIRLNDIPFWVAVKLVSERVPKLAQFLHGGNTRERRLVKRLDFCYDVH